MQTFKKIMGFLIPNILIIAAMTIMLSQPSVVKVLLKEAKSSEYNTLVIGESHGTASINPFVLSENTRSSAFNLSRRLLPVCDLYYILAEADAHKQYKRVILDLDGSYWVLGHEGRNAGSDTNLLWRLTGKNRLDYIWNILRKDNYNEVLCDYILNMNNIKNIPLNVRTKCSQPYLKSEEKAITAINEMIAAGNNCFEERGRGFRYGIKKSGIEWPSWSFDPKEVKDENIAAFERIVKYCNDNKIELVCIQSALPPYRLERENLGDVHDFFAGLCQEHGVPFYDMNYLKKGYLDQTDDDYVDLDGHMMGKLADRHTEVLADVLNAEDKDHFFYHSYDEVLSNLEDEKK